MLVVALLIGTGIVLYQYPLPGTEGWFPHRQQEVQGDMTSFPSQQVVPDPNLPEEIDTFQVDPEKVYQIGEAFQTANTEGLYNIAINSASMSKDTQGHPYEYFHAPPDPRFPEFNWVMDENGTFLSSHSYLFVNLTIDNLVENPVEVCVNNIRLLTIGTDNRELWRGLDPMPVYLDLVHNEYDGDDSMVALKPNESKTMTLGYIVYEGEDGGIQKGDRLVLQFNLAGAGVGDNESTLYYFPVVDLKLP